jgi:hypothetical protein
MTPIVLQVLPPVHLPAAVYDYVCAKVASDFPAAQWGGPAGVDPNIAEVVRALAVRGMTGGEGGARRSQDRQGDVPRDFTPFCSATAECGTGWKSVAALMGPPSQGPQVGASNNLAARVCKGVPAQGTGARAFVARFVTTSLKQMVVSFSFTGVGPDDLSLRL